MKIESTSGKGNFKIVKGAFAITELKFKKWFSKHAAVRYKGVNIEIKSKNFWQTQFDIFKNGMNCGSMKYHWKGNISIQLTDELGYGEGNYMFRSKGIFKRQFELTDEDGNLTLILKPKFIFRKFSYDYEVELVDVFEREEDLVEMLIYCGYAANVYMTKKAAQSAG
jgi:hypothetical protein